MADGCSPPHANRALRDAIAAIRQLAPAEVDVLAATATDDETNPLSAAAACAHPDDDFADFVRELVEVVRGRAMRALEATPSRHGAPAAGPKPPTGPTGTKFWARAGLPARWPR
jgi:hypothetical protein